MKTKCESVIHGMKAHIIDKLFWIDLVSINLALFLVIFIGMIITLIIFWCPRSERMVSPSFMYVVVKNYVRTKKSNLDIRKSKDILIHNETTWVCETMISWIIWKKTVLSYLRNLCSCEKKAWKKSQACTGFELLTSAIPGSALPIS